MRKYKILKEKDYEVEAIFSERPTLITSNTWMYRLQHGCRFYAIHLITKICVEGVYNFIGKDITLVTEESSYYN